MDKTDPQGAAAASDITSNAHHSFLGIPYGWPLALAIVGLVLLMWMAREPVRRVLWQCFFITGRMFGRWGLWLHEHGKAARLNTAEKIASHRADELADRMIVLEDRIGRRADKLPQEVGSLATKLQSTAHSLETSANALATINLNEAAEKAVRSALPRVEEGRGVTKVNRAIGATRQAMADQLKLIRPELGVVRTEAPRLRASVDKLALVEGRFTKAIDGVNKTFADYEECLHSEDRIKVASKASILIPWLIALIITAIALSGVFLNFFLIARPMAEIVGEGAKIAGVGLPTFAAMIVIFLEFVAGVVLMDAAGFTRLIPAFHTMSDRSRMILLVSALGFLVSFSLLEAALALVRENLIETDQQTRNLAISFAASPDSAPTAPVTMTKWFGISLPTLAQIVLAVVIPWLLATAALPLETIIRNSVFILQIAISYLMLAGAFICKTIAVALKNLGLFVLTVYDLIIFAPLWAERRIKGGVYAPSNTPPTGGVREKPPARRDAPPAKEQTSKGRDAKNRDQEQELQRA
ncbi:MAG: hypothetical protein GC155_18155 [Alphaproteobacteria bacterium]|nr:hypothetical protein [Alphaproteobacteria bacterium]